MKPEMENFDMFSIPLLLALTVLVGALAFTHPLMAAAKDVSVLNVAFGLRVRPQSTGVPPHPRLSDLMRPRTLVDATAVSTWAPRTTGRPGCTAVPAPWRNGMPAPAATERPIIGSGTESHAGGSLRAVCPIHHSKLPN